MQGYFALQQGIAQFWSGEAFYLTVQMGGPWDFYLEKISWAKHKWHRFFIFLFSDYFFLIEKSNDWIILDRILHNGFWENVGMCKHHLKKVFGGDQRPPSPSPLQSAPGSHCLAEPCPIPTPLLHQEYRTALKVVSCEKSFVSLLFQVIWIM